MVNRPAGGCEGCKRAYKTLTSKKSKEPPCDTCQVKLLPENEDAIKIYFLTQGQLITAGMGQIIDVNILAVKEIMDLYGINNQQRCLEKVMIIFKYMIEKWNKGV